MRHIFTACILLLVIFFTILLPGAIYAQTPPSPAKDATKNISETIFGNSIPGLECGVGGMKDGTEKCCNTTVTAPASLPWEGNNWASAIPNFLDFILSNVPILGGVLVNPIKDSFKTGMDRTNQLYEFQKKYGNVQCIYGEPKGSGTGCECIATESADLNRAVAQMCYNYLGKSKEHSQCLSCAASDGMWTAIGCVPLKLQSFVSTFLLSTGIGLGGVIALLCIIYSAFMMQTSEGNPEKIKKAQENLTSCILGLLLIIFSVFILRLIGVDILKIPFL